jgi:hypothetical protein
MKHPHIIQPQIDMLSAAQKQVRDSSLPYLMRADKKAAQLGIATVGILMYVVFVSHMLHEHILRRGILC